MIERMNAQEGKLNKYDGVECAICKNKGVIYYTKDGYDYGRDCDCMKERNIVRTLKKSGLYSDFETKTFDSFKTSTEHHKLMKDRALDFIKESSYWFFVGGQSGSGKTHICTAISKALIEQGKDFRYLPFSRVMPTIANELKSFNTETRVRAEQLFDFYKEVEILYIDDFLKVGANKDIVFELIDYRYKNNLRTIISSEFTTNDIMDFDEAIGGRILEMTNKLKYSVSISKGIEKNERMKRDAVSV